MKLNPADALAALAHIVNRAPLTPAELIGAQVALETAEVAMETEPAGQAMQAAAEVEPFAGLYVPAGQAMQAAAEGEPFAGL